MISRRRFLKTVLAASAVFQFGTAGAFAAPNPDRTLNLYNIHTEESLDICYYSAGRYDYEALDRINYLLRCHYTNKVKTIAVGVLDLLSEISSRIAPGERLRIISGYRSPEYNEYLRDMGRHVASHSYHMRGLAIDFAVDGIGTKKIAGVAKSFDSGGVGLYPEFVHIDVGPVRYW
ncbi:MAG: DUF882 domain-containing protein [Nitrospiraceae bacterium]|nr:DUF882 domain-containing protein [Nitrospiraceae bacterium]